MTQKDKVVSINYTLKDDNGNVIDSSQGEPLEYLHGYENIVPGLEEALTGMQPGESKQVTVAPEAGYGVYNKELQFQVPVEQFGPEAPEPGSMIQLSTPDGDSFLARVETIQGASVTLDANHPLAGKALHFDVEITQIREATSEELAHGHVHNGQHHH